MKNNQPLIASEKVSLSLIIPVYNESQRLSLAVTALTSKIDWGIFQPHEVIFINDGSDDDTLYLLRHFKKTISQSLSVPVKILSYPRNCGKGYAIATGMRAASGDYALMMDADMSTPMSEISRLQTAAKHRWPLTIGTRKREFTRVEKQQPWLRQRLGHVFTWLSQTILGSHVSDFTCGFKLFRRDVYEAIFSRAQIRRWGYDSEIIFLAERLGYRVHEVVIVWRNDERTHVRALRDGLRSLAELFLIRYYQMTGKYDLPERKISGQQIAIETVGANQE